MLAAAVVAALVDAEVDVPVVTADVEEDVAADVDAAVLVVDALVEAADEVVLAAVPVAAPVAIADVPDGAVVPDVEPVAFAVDPNDDVVALALALAPPMFVAPPLPVLVVALDPLHAAARPTTRATHNPSLGLRASTRIIGAAIATDVPSTSRRDFERRRGAPCLQRPALGDVGASRPRARRSPRKETAPFPRNGADRGRSCNVGCALCTLP